jgi:hypothetical protein
MNRLDLGLLLCLAAILIIVPPAVEQNGVTTPSGPSTSWLVLVIMVSPWIAVADVTIQELRSLRQLELNRTSMKSPTHRYEKS